MATNSLDFSEELIEAVREYRNQWETSSTHYKDNEMTVNSWKAVGSRMGRKSEDCKARWINLRDEYNKATKDDSRSTCKEKKEFWVGETDGVPQGGTLVRMQVGESRFEFVSNIGC